LFSAPFAHTKTVTVSEKIVIFANDNYLDGMVRTTHSLDIGTKKKANGKNRTIARFGCENIPGEVPISVIFQGTPMFSHIIQKVSARAFH